MKQLTGSRRVAMLAVSALLCAIVASVSVVGRELADPVVRPIAIAITLGAAALGFGASLVLLWDVNLAKAVPLVFIVTVLSAAFLAGPLVFASPVVGLAVGVLAMQWARRWAFPPPPPASSVFREHLKELARP